MTDIDDLQTHLLAAVDASAGLDALETVRVEALGKQGRVTQLLKTLGGMSPEERQTTGPRIHALREAVTAAIGARKASLEQAALDARLASETLDLTLPVDALPAGTIHPVSQVMDELAEIFADLGFSVATGPEIETDWHKFHRAQHPRDAPGAGDARHLLSGGRDRTAGGGRRRRARDLHAAAHPYLAGADQDDVG